MNRIFKTNAAKGVNKHYNEYKEFHAREVEAHVCASFMAMSGMTTFDGKYRYTQSNLHLNFTSPQLPLICRTGSVQSLVGKPLYNSHLFTMAAILCPQDGHIHNSIELLIKTAIQHL